MALNFLLKRSGTADKRPDPTSMALGELDINYDASTGGVFYKDSTGGVVKVGSAQVSATAPNATPAGSAGNSTGEFWYDTDTSTLKMWNGTTWVSTGGGGGSGTVTSITAGAGLTGGTITTSGTINLDTTCVVEPLDFTALGQILVGTGVSTYSALSVGTNGQMLYACSACPTGVRWGAAPTTSAATPIVAGTLKGCIAVTGLSGNITALGCSAGQGYSGGYAGGTAIGYFAMNALTSGDNNTAVGASSAQNMDGATGNTLLGASSGNGLSTGSCNVFLGLSTGSSVSTGIRNVVVGPQVNVSEGSCQLAIGYDATNNWLTGDSTKAIRPGAGIIDCAGSSGTAGQVLMSNGSNAICWGTAGGGGSGSFATPTACGVVYGVSNLTDSSSALGYGALSTNRGTCNVAIGVNSMLCGTSSWVCNVSLGNTALQGTTGGATATNVCRNVAIGTRAMEFLGSGAQNNIADNIGIGVCALYNLRGGNLNNVAIGTNSQASLCTSCNVSVGAYSLCRAGAGACNVVVGHLAGSGLCGGGSSNTLIGHCAGGGAFMTGNFNVLIGADTSAPVAAGSNQLVLGPWMTGCSNQSIRPQAGIVDRLGSTGTVGQYLWTSGSNAIQWASSSPSDVRDKEIIGEMLTALPIVNDLNVISYYWKDRNADERMNDEIIYGFSAQQMRFVDPVLVDDSDEEYLRIYDKKLVPLLVKSIQELSAQNSILEARITQLESSLNG